jgi:hypothetical protein
MICAFVEMEKEGKLVEGFVEQYLTFEVSQPTKVDKF